MEISALTLLEYFYRHHDEHGLTRHEVSTTPFAKLGQMVTVAQINKFLRDSKPVPLGNGSSVIPITNDFLTEAVADDFADRLKGMVVKRSFDRNRAHPYRVIYHEPTQRAA